VLNYIIIISGVSLQKGVAKIPVFNEDYVREILEEVAVRRRGLSRDDFDRLCRPDMTAGFQPEVDEASRGYFTKNEFQSTARR
jgi:hypothetical protein